MKNEKKKRKEKFILVPKYLTQEQVMAIDGLLTDNIKVKSTKMPQNNRTRAEDKP